MTAVERRDSFGSTSAAGAMCKSTGREPIILGRILAGLETFAALSAFHHWQWGSPSAEEGTTAGAAISSAQPPVAAMGELRRLSGLTWDQLARIFGVSRRSLHFWESGKPMAPSNEEHLQRVIAVLRRIDRGAAGVNRTALLGVCQDGSIPLDLLIEGKYERVVSLLGPGEGRRRTPPKLSKEARATRAPSPPDELVGALQDRVHLESGAVRAGKSARVRSGSR